MYGSSEPPEQYAARLNRAIALIDAHIDQDLSLQALADAACLSPHHFHRIFSALTGETVQTFTTRLRLERALRLARLQPAENWKRIAGRVGYRALPTFSRAFKRVYGVSPSAFDLDAYWSSRPDRAEAHRISAYFLRADPLLPQDFRVDLIERPAADLATITVQGAYLDPSAMIAAYQRLVDWADRQGLPVGGGRLSGGSRDDPEVTPLSRCRYRFALEVAPGTGLPAPFVRGTRAAGWWAVHHCDGDMAAVDRGWNVLFKSWLPASGLLLRDEPAEETYQRLPTEIGWDRFDLNMCLPVQSEGK